MSGAYGLIIYAHAQSTNRHIRYKQTHYSYHKGNVCRCRLKLEPGEILGMSHIKLTNPQGWII